MGTRVETTSTVVSVERAFIILNLLANNPQGLGIREIGHTLGYSAGAVQKILNTLRMQNVVNKKSSTDKYVLGVTALRLAQQIISQTDLLMVTRPFLEELAEQTGETAFLAVRDRLVAVYMDKVVSRQELRVEPPLNVPRPLNATAVGQVLLAYADEDLVSSLVEANAIEKGSEFTITDPDVLRERTEAILRQKYAHDSREYLVSASSLAAPVFDEEGNVTAAIAICGPAERIDNHVDELRETLLTLANRLNQSLGYVTQ